MLLVHIIGVINSVYSYHVSNFTNGYQYKPNLVPVKSENNLEKQSTNIRIKNMWTVSIRQKNSWILINIKTIFLRHRY